MAVRTKLTVKSRAGKASARAGRSQAELLEYALAKVAIEDDYAAKLLAMKGSVADDVDL